MAEGARLESVYTATYRGFESLLTAKYNPLNFNGFFSFLDLRDFFLINWVETIMYLSKMPPAPTTLVSRRLSHYVTVACPSLSVLPLHQRSSARRRPKPGCGSSYSRTYRGYPADTAPAVSIADPRRSDAFKAAGSSLLKHLPHLVNLLLMPPACPSSGIMLTHALARFIETKTSEGIQHRSVGQLQLRINAFVTWAKGVKSR